VKLYCLIFYGMLGLVIGSFLNVVISRLPLGQSISKPRSHCPRCGHFLRPWELIPVISFLCLRGRCGSCKNKISWRYPVVELLTAVLFGAAYLLRPERSITGLFFDLIFISLLIALAFIDFDTFRLPDMLVLQVALTALANTLVSGEPGIWRSLLGAVFAGGVFLLIFLFYSKGMGLGDVKFVAALGLYIGEPGILAAVFLASILGVIFGGLWLAFYRKNLKEPLPFGPFLAAGALLVLLCPQQLLELYHYLLS